MMNINGWGQIGVEVTYNGVEKDEGCQKTGEEVEEKERNKDLKT